MRLPYYAAAVAALPDSALLKMELAQVQLESGDPCLDQAKALANLNDCVAVERDNGEAWHLLAVAYGRQQNIAMAALALAEEADFERRQEGGGTAILPRDATAAPRLTRVAARRRHPPVEPSHRRLGQPTL